MARTDFPACLFRPREGFYTSEVQAPRGWPLRTFLPTGYEPNYPYPLVVFLHGHGGSDEQMLRLAPRLSRRNYICISLRGPHPLGQRPDGRAAFTWGSDGDDDSQVEDYVLRAVEETRRRYHVHSERIYLAGFREGAALAYRLGLLYPERFGGVVSLNGVMPRGGPLLRLPEVRHLRVLIGHGIANAVVAARPGPRRLPPALHRRPRRPDAHLPDQPPHPSRHAARHRPLDHGADHHEEQ